MQLKFAHLADYAATDAGGKLTIVGLFDRIFDQLKQRPIPFPPFTIVAVFEAPVTEGTDHRVQLHFLNSDAVAVRPQVEMPIKFVPQGKGRPLVAPFIWRFGPGTVVVPELGDYEFRFVMEGRDLGELPVAVVPVPVR